MSIDFRRLIEAIDSSPLINIDYIDYIDCPPMIDFNRMGAPGKCRGQRIKQKYNFFFELCFRALTSKPEHFEPENRHFEYK